LFYRILQSRIMDYFRRKTVYSKLFFWKSLAVDEQESEELHVQASDHITPERQVTGQRNIKQVSEALKNLPLRQQQCFLLRSWEGLSVIETAEIMGCSQGSVKTHYSRARNALKNALSEDLF